jgi:tetratricopeptide (TPR) repeat protein
MKMRQPPPPIARSLNSVELLTLIVFLTAGTLSKAAEAPHTLGPVSPAITDTDSAAELKKIEDADDAAQAEVNTWLRENNALKEKGTGSSEAEIERRIAARFEPVRRKYEDFVRRHPGDARAHLVYGSFLNDRQDENGARVQWEQALALDPANPAIYNNLAGRYSESGPVNKAFEYFAKAIELRPAEPVYYHNFADSLYVLRNRAATYYGLSEQQVYGKSLLLYSNALRLDPTNFAFARDLAQTFYSLKPLPTDAALSAWTNALSIGRDEADREDVYVHLARVKMLAGRLMEAREQLQAVTNQSSLAAKTALLRNLQEREKQARPNDVPNSGATKP